MFMTPEETLKMFNQSFGSVPEYATNPAKIKELFEKLKDIFEIEAKTLVEVVKGYQKIATGEAFIWDISALNKKFQGLLQSAGFFFLVTVPGVIFLLPTLVEMARGYDIDLVPASVSSVFKL